MGLCGILVVWAACVTGYFKGPARCCCTRVPAHWCMCTVCQPTVGCTYTHACAWDAAAAAAAVWFGLQGHAGDMCDRSPGWCCAASWYIGVCVQFDYHTGDCMYTPHTVDCMYTPHTVGCMYTPHTVGCMYTCACAWDRVVAVLLWSDWGREGGGRRLMTCMGCRVAVGSAACWQHVQQCVTVVRRSGLSGPATSAASSCIGVCVQPPSRTTKLLVQTCL